MSPFPLDNTNEHWGLTSQFGHKSPTGILTPLFEIPFCLPVAIKKCAALPTAQDVKDLEVQRGWKNFPPWPPFFSWWFKINHIPGRWPPWASHNISKNKWSLFTWCIKLQMVVVFTPGNKRGLPCFKAGSGLCGERRKPGGYIVSSTPRQTVSVSLTETTNVGTSQIRNYWLIHAALREERQRVFFVVELHCAIRSSWHQD